MAYIGKQPLVGNYTVLDALTATTTDTYALTKNSVAVFPQTPANCIVSLNGVIQAPYDSYTISGSNIVFASALTASDSIDFITVLGDVLNVGTVSDGTIGLAKLSATGTKDATTFLRGDNTFATPSGGTNTPAFEAYMSSGQTGVADNVFVKLNFNTERFDTNSYYDTSTYRFTPLVAGKYYIYAQAYCYPTSADSIYFADISIYKNGSNYKYTEFRANSSYPIGEVSKFIGATIEFNGSTDYVEVYGRINVTTSTGNFEGTNATNVFGGYKIIE